MLDLEIMQLALQSLYLVLFSLEDQIESLLAHPARSRVVTSTTFRGKKVFFIPIFDAIILKVTWFHYLSLGLFLGAATVAAEVKDETSDNDDN